MNQFIIIEEIELKKHEIRAMSRLLDSELIELKLQEIHSLESRLYGRTI